MVNIYILSLYCLRKNNLFEGHQDHHSYKFDSLNIPKAIFVDGIQSIIWKTGLSKYSMIKVGISLLELILSTNSWIKEVLKIVILEFIIINQW